MKVNRQIYLYCTGFLCLAGFRAQAQVYSQNIVGYINQTLYAGDNLIANQLANSDNSLTTLFSSGVPEGATFAEWNTSLNQYTPLSTYDTVTGWSINYVLSYGQGGLLNTPSTFMNTYVGTVWQGYQPPDPFVPPLVSGNGLLLLSCMIPITSANFYDVVGRDPVNGEYVTILDPSTQTESTTTFADGSWNNGPPVLNVGQSAFFDLESIAPAPEPSAYGLLGAGFLALAALRNCRRNS